MTRPFARPAGSLWGASLLALLLAACAHGPQPVTLHPAPETPTSGLGRGEMVAIQVADLRPDPSLSDVPATVATRQNFPIRGDVLEVVLGQVADGLAQQGFEPVTAGEAPVSLTVEVQRLDHWVLTGFGVSDIHAVAALNAVARRGGASYEVLYRVDQHQRVVFRPRQADVEETVNDALSGVLARVLEDERLLAFLAPGG